MAQTLNWQDLEIFHAVLEQGSFSGAARYLGVSQPTVSRHIEGLERKLGKELFSRGVSGLEPSAFAQVLARHAAAMSEEMFAIRRALDGEEAAPEGIVTLSLPYALGTVLVAHALEGFYRQYPDISIDLKFGPPRSNLGRREADIDLRWSAPSEPEVISRSLGSFHLGLVATEGYLQRHGRPRQLTDLNDHFFPWYDEEVSTPVYEQLAAVGVTPRRFPFRYTSNFMAATVLCSVGLTLGFGGREFAPGNLVRLFPEFHIHSPPLWLAMHASLRRNAPIRAVWDWLVVQLPAVLDITRTSPE